VPALASLSMMRWGPLAPGAGMRLCHRCEALTSWLAPQVALRALLALARHPPAAQPRRSNQAAGRRPVTARRAACLPTWSNWGRERMEPGRMCRRAAPPQSRGRTETGTARRRCSRGTSGCAGAPVVKSKGMLYILLDEGLPACVRGDIRTPIPGRRMLTNAGTYASTMHMSLGGGEGGHDTFTARACIRACSCPAADPYGGPGPACSKAPPGLRPTCSWGWTTRSGCAAALDICSSSDRPQRMCARCLRSGRCGSVRPNGDGLPSGCHR
jgi:hypothetical protein